MEDLNELIGRLPLPLSLFRFINQTYLVFSVKDFEDNREKIKARNMPGINIKEAGTTYEGRAFLHFQNPLTLDVEKKGYHLKSSARDLTGKLDIAYIMLKNSQLSARSQICLLRRIDEKSSLPDKSNPSRYGSNGPNLSIRMYNPWFLYTPSNGELALLSFEKNGPSRSQSRFSMNYLEKLALGHAAA